MAKAAVPAAKLELYDTLVATVRGIERKGATTPYTSLNGHMFSFMTKKGRLALRLSAVDRSTFMKKYSAHLCVQHGREMAEYVEVPDGLLRRTRELRIFFDRSVSYVSSLTPKPTTRPKASATKKKTTRKKTSKTSTTVRKKSATAKKKTTSKKKTVKKKATTKKASARKTASKTTARKTSSTRKTTRKSVAKRSTATKKKTSKKKTTKKKTTRKKSR